MKTLWLIYVCAGLGLCSWYESREIRGIAPSSDSKVLIQPSVRQSTGGGGSSFWYSGSRGGK